MIYAGVCRIVGQMNPVLPSGTQLLKNWCLHIQAAVLMGPLLPREPRAHALKMPVCGCVPCSFVPNRRHALEVIIIHTLLTKEDKAAPEPEHLVVMLCIGG